MSKARYEVFEGEKKGQWFFRVVAANNEITSRSSETYPNKSAAVAGAEADKRACTEGAITVKG